jgi:hypothetical protein
MYSLYIQETILCVKERCDCTVNEQMHSYNTRNNKDHHKYWHNLELYKGKPSVAGCTFYNKLPNNIKQKTITSLQGNWGSCFLRGATTQ